MNKMTELENLAATAKRYLDIICSNLVYFDLDAEDGYLYQRLSSLGFDNIESDYYDGPMLKCTSGEVKISSVYCANCHNFIIEGYQYELSINENIVGEGNLHDISDDKFYHTFPFVKKVNSTCDYVVINNRSTEIIEVLNDLNVFFKGYDLSRIYNSPDVYLVPRIIKRY